MEGIVKMRKTYEQMLSCNCGTANTLAVIGGKWKIMIMYHLIDGKKRFNELIRILNSITPHTLSKDLKELEKDGLIQKHTYEIIPPKTEYSLTNKGRELECVLIAINKFGEKYPIKFGD